VSQKREKETVLRIEIGMLAVELIRNGYASSLKQAVLMARDVIVEIFKLEACDCPECSKNVDPNNN
jgi:hypothetical protein